ncbi:hypothetical protein A3K63_04075, partial [Candidatus Micrarchaeota archaeon RBG_16_49_10]
MISDRRGRILLVRSERWPGVNCFTLPGGHVEIGEKLEDALKREVMEEVGVKIRVMEVLAVQESIFSKEFFLPRHFIFIHFLCKSLTSRVKLDLDELQGYA